MVAILDDEAAGLRRAIAELQRRLDEALSERDESEAQKAAMAEILEVINSSPGDLAPVFDAMLEKAIRVCDAIQGTLWRFGERIQLAASQGLSAELVEALRERRERQDPGENDPVRRIMRGSALSKFSMLLRIARMGELSPPEPNLVESVPSSSWLW